MTRRGLIPSWLTAASLRRLGKILQTAGRDFFTDDGPTWAAAIAYYSLLSLFPLLLTVGSVAAFFVDRSWAVHRATLYLGDLLPRGPGAIERVVKQTLEAGRGPGLLSLLPLLWTASLFFNAVTRALNVAFEAERPYTMRRRILVRFLMMLGLSGMFLAALAASAVLRFLHARLEFLPGREFIFQVIVNSLPAASVFVAFTAIYRYLPRRRPSWRAALFGAGVAALLFAAAKPLFLGYVLQTGRYAMIYGSLAGIVVVVFWTWIMAMIGLFGGQVAFHSHEEFPGPDRATHEAGPLKAEESRAS